MAATLAQRAQIASTSAFQQRVSVAMSDAAAAIYNEGSGVTSHSARAAYAIKVVNGNFNLAAAALAVIGAAAIITEATLDPTVNPPNAIPDADIANSVSALWNMLAGV
jgi:hypothetical protein